MTKAAKEFLKSTTTKMDEILAALTPEEQHDRLDALAGEVEERLDELIDTEGHGSCFSSEPPNAALPQLS